MPVSSELELRSRQHRYYCLSDFKAEMYKKIGKAHTEIAVRCREWFTRAESVGMEANKRGGWASVLKMAKVRNIIK
jgi:hypothetical protein